VRSAGGVMAVQARAATGSHLACMLGRRRLLRTGVWYIAGAAHSTVWPQCGHGHATVSAHLIPAFYAGWPIDAVADHVPEAVVMAEVGAAPGEAGTASCLGLIEQLSASRWSCPVSLSTDGQGKGNQLCRPAHGQVHRRGSARRPDCSSQKPDPRDKLGSAATKWPER